MRQQFEVENIKCNGCATKVRNSLKEEFGDVEVDLEKMPRVITLEIEQEKVPALREKMKAMGYPFCDEQLSGFESATSKAKSFVSCAIGKMDSTEK